ncbi:MAG: hypothetical protein ACQEXJ_21910 [Myxococcota bacterium]
MSIQVYFALHIFAILLLFLGLGARTAQALDGGEPRKGKLLATVSHGLGLFLILLAGFGMLARMGITWPWPHWVIVKVAIWVILGVLVVVPKRVPNLSVLVWIVFALLGLVAAYAAKYKAVVF